MRSPISRYLAPVEPPPTRGDRIAALFDEELRLLAVGVGDHLPVELAERVKRLRAERLLLAGGELPPAP